MVEKVVFILKLHKNNDKKTVNEETRIKIGQFLKTYILIILSMGLVTQMTKGVDVTNHRKMSRYNLLNPRTKETRKVGGT